MQVQGTRVDEDTALLTFAASAADRTLELLSDGWVKGRLNGGEGGAETFCIHGALGLALEEIFGQSGVCGRVPVCGGFATDRRADVEALVTAFIVDGAATEFGYDGNAWKHHSLGAAAFNDAQERTHEQVLRVVRQASTRLWALALGEDTFAAQDDKGQTSGITVSPEAARDLMTHAFA